MILPLAIKCTTTARIGVPGLPDGWLTRGLGCTHTLKRVMTNIAFL